MSARRWVMAAVVCLLALPAWAQKQGAVAQPLIVLPWVTLNSPAAGQQFTAGSNVVLSASGIPYTGEIQSTKIYLDGSLYANVMGPEVAANWTATLGTHTIYARTTDEAASKSSPTITITVIANTPPTVSLTAPTNGTVYAVGAAVSMAATASDTDGTIARVEFWVDGAKVGQANSSPYAYTWTGTVGDHTVLAKAVDNANGTTSTSAITIHGNAPPIASLTAPANGTVYLAGSAVAMSATASDSDGTVSKVEFFVDGSLAATDTGSPYSASWTATTVGSHAVTARATDNNGATTTTAATSITVTGDPPPTVTLTAPSNGATYTAGDTVTFSATASDNGSITKVEFYLDGSLSGSDTSNPYSKTWTAATGTHTVEAKAYDNAGGSTFSGQASITVNLPPNNPPSVSLTSPANGAAFTTGDTVSLAATASDSDGTVTKVEFYVDDVLQATDTGSPFAASWTATVGSHTIKARATDDDGASTYGSTATITVAAPAVTVVRSYFYNSYQELCRVQEPEIGPAEDNAGATLMGYDAAGNLAWSASGLAPGTACSSTGSGVDRKVTRTYDARNRVSTLIFPDGNGNQSWDYTPDGLPETVTTWNDGGASSVVNTYAYNKRRLLTGESQASGSNTWTVGYGYDANASLSTLVYPDSLTVGYAPNALGQPTQAGTYATNVTYYPNGAIAGFTYGNGIVHSLAQNARGLPRISKDANGATAILQDEYVYDAVGNVLAITDAATGQSQRGNRDMTYDALNRLTRVTGEAGAPSPMFGIASYSYDVLDNLTHVAVTGGSQARDQTYVYDAHNRLTNIMAGGVSVIGLGYDVQGNLANRNGTTHTFTFDYGNRLRAGELETYRYDVQGRRTRSSNSAGVIYSLYAQSGQLLFQRDERSAKRRQYIYLGGSLVAESAVPLAGGAATVTYQHTDALGSPVATTNSSKTVLQRSEYEPYGYLLNRVMEDGPGYTGHVTDAATGLVYMQQRYYDPELGEFPSTDPVTPFSPGGAFNRYWYGAANPYRFTDPDGRTPNEVYLASGGDWGSGQTVSAGKKNRSVPISKSESAALEAGDLKAFWASRLLRGDPWGREGASIWDRGNPSLSTADLARGELAVRWLLGAMAKRDGLDSSILSRPEGLIGLAQNYRGEITQIGVAVARGHASLVTANRGNTVGLGASAVMHHRVFAPFGLPPTAYGGTPLFWGLAPGIQSYYINQIVDFCHGCPR